MARAQQRHALAHVWSPLEQLVLRGQLRIAQVRDLDPVGAPTVRVIATVRRLWHDALEIVRARDAEEVSPAGMVWNIRLAGADAG
jgi:hypothetical protein